MIYIVENDNSVRRSLEVYLDSVGMHFRSYESAISYLSEGMATEKDVLLLDMNLPDMNGIELLKKLSVGEKHIPTIVITSVVDERIIELCRSLGVKAFLRKPVDGGSLIDLIKYHAQS